MTTPVNDIIALVESTEWKDSITTGQRIEMVWKWYDAVKASTRFVPPTPEQVADYAGPKCLQIDGEKFVNFYQSKGWMVGKNKMKDWQAAVRNWCSEGKGRPVQAYIMKSSDVRSDPQEMY